MKHRILALLLAISLLVCVMPTAWAADYTVQELYEILQDTDELIRTEGLESSEDDDPLDRALTAHLETIPSESELLALLEAQPQLFEALMSTMLSGYDQYTLYLPAGSYSAAYDPDTNYVGVGVTIQAHELGALVVEVNLTGSAALAGLRAGDILIEAAGQSLTGLDASAISNLLRGEVNTEVSVKVLRGKEELSFTLQRTALTQLSYSGASLGDGVFYMKWSRIDNDGSYLLFRLQLAQMIREGHEALILDLRDNPGGSLDLAFNIASDLMDEPGAFFRIAYRHPREEGTLEYKFINADGDGVDIPHIYVLVNGDSASAAEIITSGLQAKENATVIGETTYGKARAQQHYVLETDAGIVLTTMLLLPLAGEDYEGVGLEPDVEVENTVRRKKTDIQVPVNVALAPYSCSDNGEALNRALVSLGLLEALPEKPYQLGEDTLAALDLLQAVWQLNDSTPGAGIPTLLLVNQLLEQQRQGSYAVDVQLNTAIQMAKEALQTP